MHSISAALQLATDLTLSANKCRSPINQWADNQQIPVADQQTQATDQQTQVTGQQTRPQRR